VDNAALADQLEAFSTLLELNDSGYYAVRAYRRAAELIRATPVDVAELVRTGRVRELAGIGPSIEARLRELVETGDLAELRELGDRILPELADRPRRGLLLGRAREIVGDVAAALGGEPAGDPRRGCELSNQLAVVVPADTALDELESLAPLVAVLAREEERAVALTRDGQPIEIVAAPAERFGTALVRATGSIEYVASLGELPEAATEEEVFRRLGLPFRPPELRELEAADPPADLLELGHVRGDLHVHTTASDGKASVEEMGRAALVLGYEYLAICDHTRAVRVVPGLDADDLRRQAEEIAAANELLAPLRILRGSECDILADGSLDLSDDVLAELDWVQVSLHAGQRWERDRLTDRVIEAMRHPAARCLSHPKGRLLNHRPENALDLERVFEVALETGVALEVNGLPDRLDLSGAHVREALAAGVRIVCSTDAHSTRGLANMALTVATARRGGAPRVAVLNTLPLDELLRRPA
jgi:DNA polymerase (family X)